MGPDLRVQKKKSPESSHAKQMELTQLTSFEVLTWLQARKRVRELDVKSRTTTVESPHQQSALVSPAIVARNREIKWVENKTLKFLSAGPAARQSAPLLKAILKAVEIKTAAWGISLSQKQRVQLLDAQPTTALDVFLCLDECPGLDEERQEALAAEISALVAEHDIPPPEAAAPPPEPVAGHKRPRSNSTAMSANVAPLATPGDATVLGAAAVPAPTTVNAGASLPQAQHRGERRVKGTDRK